MRCLYCGKELALLKRLRGGGDFCSEAHKQSYQEEYNRLALSRLLQAQKKGKQGQAAGALAAAEQPKAVEAPQAVVALDAPEPEIQETEVAAPVHAPAAQLESAAPEPIEAPADNEPEPTESADFILEAPATAQAADASPQLATWLERESFEEPSIAGWQIQTLAFALGSTDLLSIEVDIPETKLEDRKAQFDTSPEQFAAPEAELSPLQSPKLGIPKKRFAVASTLAIDTPPTSNIAVGQVAAKTVEFETPLVIEEPPLLALSHTAIEFPAGDADVIPLHVVTSNGTPPAAGQAPAQGPASNMPGTSPKDALRALSRLHQELAEQESARPEEPSSIAVEVQEAPPVPVKVVRTVAVNVVAKPAPAPQALQPVKTVAAESERVIPPEPVKVVEIAAEPVATPAHAVEELEAEPEAQQPAVATELLEIPIKLCAPAKAVAMAGGTCAPQIAPLLPNLKSLPLRPKMALATGYVPPGKAPAPAQNKSAKPAPAARTEAPKGTPPKPAQVSAKAPAPDAKPAQKPASAPQQAAKGIQPAPKAAAAKVEPPKPEAKQKPAEAKPEPVRTDQPKTEAPKAEPTKTDQAKPKAEPARPAVAAMKDVASKDNAVRELPSSQDDVPSFGGAQPAAPGWLGSLKLKLGLAIALLAIACTYFIGWGGGKPHTQGSGGVSSDGSGPSIILGEGGWVEDWGGDPNGMHAGRQITIYRPSLKLSDYRLEFQGTIDLKSLGWVFRAADPQNYYAMKLMLVQSGLSSKVALFKYLVANGKQTQVGRVPIDIAVQADTVFNVRLDVRGPQFTTYIQGQQVDSWTDDQLKVGGTGFLNEREERGKVKSVSIRYLSGGAK